LSKQKFLTLPSAICAAMVLAACASTVITDDTLVDRTAFALGLAKTDFSISQRVDDGNTTRYAVRSKSGQEFNCSIGGFFNGFGRVVTDAICNKKGEQAKNPLLGR
jgi:hypothetical protein